MSAIIVTGASSGIGKETAICLKKSGYTVVGTYNASEQSANLIKKEHGIPFFRCDVSCESDLVSLFNAVKKNYGSITAVVANAGVALCQKPLVDVCESEIDKVLSVNLKGTLLTNKTAVNFMLSNGGKIINVSSIFGLEGGSCEAVYSASKAGIIGLTKALADELSSSNISVCCVCPAFVETAMTAHLSESDKQGFLDLYGVDRVYSAQEIGGEICKLIITEEALNGKIFTLYNRRN